MVRGIADEDILADLIGEEKTDRTLLEMVEFIARKEQAKLEIPYSTLPYPTFLLFSPNFESQHRIKCIL